VKTKFLNLLAASALLSAPLAAQSNLSGTWTGYIGRSEAQPSAIKFEMKQGSDGKLSGVLTGPQLTPGDVKDGWYDAATGSLKLTILVRSKDGEKGGEVTFDGRVARDTAAGSMLLGGETGVFKWVKQGKEVVDYIVVKQDPGTAAAKRGFVEVSGWIARAADLVPPDKYTYKPAASVRTYGQLVAHVVDGYRYYCAAAAGKKQEWTDATEKGNVTKAAVAQALKQATADCNAAYASGKEIGAMMENVAHSNLHYGNMITYIRMLGMTPPSS
jgi:hypothetical protein